MEFSPSFIQEGQRYAKMFFITYFSKYEKQTFITAFSDTGYFQINLKNCYIAVYLILTVIINCAQCELIFLLKDCVPS
jgi:hypothetical protein